MFTINLTARAGLEINMNIPAMFDPIRIDEMTHSLPAFAPLPGYGVIPVNSFVIGGAEPVLVDTGMAAVRDGFLEALGSIIDPGGLRWIWITHMDADHIGNLQEVLALAPGARVVTTYVGLAKMGLLGLRQDRVYLLNPGQSLQLPDRALDCLRPLCFDAPETTALFDRASGIYFSADTFGAIMDSPADDASGIAPNDLRDGLMTWASIDSPWLRWLDANAFRARLKEVEAMRPKAILSSHLPPARGMDERPLANLDAARGDEPFAGPDQAAFEAMAAA